MKVILQRDIPKLGKGGDIVNVADGYARNYLFPRQYAVAASGGALKAHAARLEREKEKSAKLAEEAKAHAGKLEGLSLILLGKVGGGTKLYGSITAQDVAEAIARESGVTVDKRRVGLVDPIKNLGLYTVPVRLHSDIVVPVKVEVTTEEELERRKAQAAAEAAAAEAAALANAPLAEGVAEAQEPPAPATAEEIAPETPAETETDSAQE